MMKLIGILLTMKQNLTTRKIMMDPMNKYFDKIKSLIVYVGDVLLDFYLH